MARLIARLTDATAHFVVVVDSKVASKELASFRTTMWPQTNVQIIRTLSIEWGRFSLTKANILGLQKLSERQIPFDYVFSMSGQDYPLVNVAEIKRVLREAQGSSFLEHYPFPISRWIDGGEGRLYSWNFFLPGSHIIQLPKATVPGNPLVRLLYKALSTFVPRRGPLPNSMKPYGGSMHWILSREAADYVREFLKAYPEYIRRFRFTLVSDEIFFQTILANSPLNTKLNNSDQRYLRWPSADAPSPAVLTTKDLPAMRNQGMLFARKFDTTVDTGVLDAIDAQAD